LVIYILFYYFHFAILGRLQVAKLIPWEGRILNISAWREEGLGIGKGASGYHVNS
jgi:hypothetical protein